MPNSDVPRGFVCPITQAIMRQPALLLHDATVTPSTYDKEAISQWLAEHRWDAARVTGAGSAAQGCLQGKLLNCSPLQCAGSSTNECSCGDIYVSVILLLISPCTCLACLHACCCSLPAAALTPRRQAASST
jgi:hypothetical protein